MEKTTDFRMTEKAFNAFDKNLSPSAGCPETMADTEILESLISSHEKNIPMMLSMLDLKGTDRLFKNPSDWMADWLWMLTTDAEKNEGVTRNGLKEFIQDEIRTSGKDLDEMANGYFKEAVEHLAFCDNELRNLKILKEMNLSEMPMLHSVFEWTRFCKRNSKQSEI